MWYIIENPVTNYKLVYGHVSPEEKKSSEYTQKENPYELLGNNTQIKLSNNKICEPKVPSLSVAIN